MILHRIELEDGQLSNLLDMVNRDIKTGREWITKEGFDTNGGITFSNLQYMEQIRDILMRSKLDLMEAGKKVK